MEPNFLSLFGVSWGPHTPQDTCPSAGPSHPPSRGCPGSVRMQVGHPVPPRNRSPRRKGEERAPRLTPGVAGPRERRSTRPACPTRAWRPAHPGELRGAEVPGEATSGAGAQPAEDNRRAEPRGRSHKVTNPARRGSERASDRPGRSFERVYLRTLQAERARNSRISSEAANICRQEKEAEPGRDAASLPPEPRRRPGRTRPRS